MKHTCLNRLDKNRWTDHFKHNWTNSSYITIQIQQIRSNRSDQTDQIKQIRSNRSDQTDENKHIKLNRSNWIDEINKLEKRSDETVDTHLTLWNIKFGLNRSYQTDQIIQIGPINSDYTELIEAYRLFCAFAHLCFKSIVYPYPMFVERNVSYSALFTFLVGWHASALSLPTGDVIFARPPCSLNDVIFCSHQE
jgi:hypothetical protein